MIIQPTFAETLPERLARLRAEWTYKRYLGWTGRDTATPVMRACENEYLAAKRRLARHWLDAHPPRGRIARVAPVSEYYRVPWPENVVSLRPQAG